jgi:hypothetical protein
VTGLAPPGGDLQPWELAGAAYRVLWRGRAELLRVAAVPVAIILLIEVAVRWQAGNILSVGLGLLSVPLGILMAVNWLRVLLLGSGSVSGLGARWGERETRFLLRWLVVSLVSFAPSLALCLPVILVMMLLGQDIRNPGLATQAMLLPIFIGAMSVCAYVLLRYSLALVAAAIDAPGTLTGSWATSAAGASVWFSPASRWSARSTPWCCWRRCCSTFPAWRRSRRFPVCWCR